MAPAVMTEVSPKHANQAGRVLLALIVGVLLGFSGVLISSRTALLTGWMGSLQRAMHISVAQPTVVSHIQQLQRVETVSFTMDKVVTGGHESEVLPDFLAGDKLLMIVHGDVVAGVDFSRLQPGDVTVLGSQVTLHLPDAEIFSTRLDSANTKVYSRQTGLLVPADPNLETEVRQQAENNLRESALSGNILATAQQNARSTLTSLLQGLGFKDVQFH
ncbi:MAG: DUF4230 domain-containing protein [Acidobacteriales bacterium]|nr:DUF4230 domain-containing protein [Terriglobales bacterium]